MTTKTKTKTIEERLTAIELNIALVVHELRNIAQQLALQSTLNAFVERETLPAPSVEGTIEP